MLERCYGNDPHHVKHYRDRGIKVCERWKTSFENFYADMGPKPSAKHTIDRHPDNNGDYEPSNCRWATSAEQRRNLSCTVFVEHQGERVKLVDLVEQLGLSRNHVYQRLKNGWSLAEALALPVREHVKAG
jgi:hypothetical protein